jgi:hypothetical protein
MPTVMPRRVSFLKPVKLDFDRVRAGADRREDVGAVAARHAGQRERLDLRA